MPFKAGAQSVQASAFADGSNHHVQLDRAINILNVVKADYAALDCGGSGTGQPPTQMNDGTAVHAGDLCQVA